MQRKRHWTEQGQGPNKEHSHETLVIKCNNTSKTTKAQSRFLPKSINMIPINEFVPNISEQTGRLNEN
jgi:hypothetical protein